MSTGIRRPKEVVSGLAFVVIGAAFLVASQRYEIGSATAMGPGYFPALCGIVLMLLGGASVAWGLLQRTADRIPAHDIEPLFLILAGIVSFGLLIERAGLVPATFVCILFVCFRALLKTPLEVLAIFAVLTTFNIVVFVYGFGMTVPLFWWAR